MVAILWLQSASTLHFTRYNDDAQLTQYHRPLEMLRIHHLASDYKAQCSLETTGCLTRPCKPSCL